jgi:hypothetical protein
LPFYVLKLHGKIKKAKSGEERRRLEPELIALLKEIDKATDKAVATGTLNNDDTRVVIELLDKVYNHLYRSYPELQEANKMAEQFLELRTDKLANELREAKLRVEKIEKKYSQEKQAIAANMRSIGLNDEQISRVLTIQ